MQNSHNKIVFLFTITQLIILLVFGYTPYPDSDGYLLLANDSLQYGEPYPVASKINEYAFLWNIGAINITALSLRLFHSITPLLVFYALLKGVTSWLFYAVTKEIFGKRTAFIALLLYVLYPANYGESTSLLSELPFIFFILLGMYLSLVRKLSLFGGMMMAIANWFRPMAIIFILAMILFFLYKWRRSIKLLIGYSIMITIIGCATMHRTGLFLYKAKTGWMALTDYSTNNSSESLSIHERTDLNVTQKDSAWQSLFFDWLKDHPKEYISQMPSKLVNTYVSDNVNMCTFIPNKTTKDYMYEEVSMSSIVNAFPKCSVVQWLTIINLIIYYCLLITALFSLFYYNKNTTLLPVSTIILGTLLLLFVGHGEARFHQPFMPFFIMLSASFVNSKICKG